MTPLQSAAGADQPRIWGGGINVGEPSRDPLSPDRRLGPLRFTEGLSAAATYLQAGWRWFLRKRAMQLASRRMRVTETISIGDKRTVCIVEVDGAQFLIGSSATNVQLLARLNNRDDTVSGEESHATHGLKTQKESA